jgi:hypothetical protein
MINRQQLAILVETLSHATAPTKPTTRANPTADFDRTAGGRHGHDAQHGDTNDNPLEYIDPIEWTDYASRAFAECMHPIGKTAPCVWNPRHDEADNSLWIPLEFPCATNSATCFAMVCLRPPLTRHPKLLWKRFARVSLPRTRRPTPTPSST